MHFLSTNILYSQTSNQSSLDADTTINELKKKVEILTEELNKSQNKVKSLTEGLNKSNQQIQSLKTGNKAQKKDNKTLRNAVKALKNQSLTEDKQKQVMDSISDLLVSD